MNDWMVGLIYLFGVLHAIPAWYFGKAAGLKRARRIVYDDWASVAKYEAAPPDDSGW